MDRQQLIELRRALEVAAEIANKQAHLASQSKEYNVILVRTLSSIAESLADDIASIKKILSEQPIDDPDDESEEEAEARLLDEARMNQIRWEKEVFGKILG